MSDTGWEVALLDAIGAPQSVDNVGALALWAQSEGVPADCNNPLAASDVPSGARADCSGSAAGYPSLDFAVNVYAAKFGTQDYEAIGKALKDDAGYQAIYEAINASPWCKGCQGGHYPEALYADLGTLATPAGEPGGETLQAAATKGVYGTQGPITPSDPSGAADTYGGTPTTHSGWGALRSAVNRSLVRALIVSEGG